MISKKVYVGRFIPKKDRLKYIENSWTNVYVRNLDKDLTNEELSVLFKQWGAISSCCVMTEPNGESKGFGFVNFIKHEDAAFCVQEIQRGFVKNKEGIPLYACKAQKKAERTAELSKKFEQQKMERMSKYQGINLYIKNIEDEITEERLRSEFSPFGTIRSVKIMVDDKGNNKGFGFVCFNIPEEAQRAILEMNGRILSGCSKPLYVNLHEPKEVRKQKLLAQISARKSIRPGSIASQGTPQMYPPMFYPQGPGPMSIPANLPQGFVYQQVPPRGPMSAPPPTPQYNLVQPIQLIPPMPHRPTRVNRGGTNVSVPMNRRPNNNPRPQQTQSQQSSKILSEDSLDPSFDRGVLESLSPEEQKQIIGQRIYQLIFRKEPQLAAKITGMLIELPFEDLLPLLDSEEALNLKMEEALRLLRARQQQNNESSVSI